METWKDVVGYEGLYEVSDKGNVRSKKTGKVLKWFNNGYGYLIVSLFKNGNRKHLRIHRLVAEAFIPNPENKPCVDHIDTDRTNNNVSNLRWCTYKENNNNVITKERIKEAVKLNQRLAVAKSAENRKKKVLCVTTNKIFDSAKEAAIYYHIKNIISVGNAANPKQSQKTAGTLPDGTPLEWKYI